MSTPNPKLPEEQPNPYTPSSSTVASVGIGLPVAVVVAWVLEAVIHVQMPLEVSMALGTIVSTVVGYFGNGGKAIHTT